MFVSALNVMYNDILSKPHCTVAVIEANIYDIFEDKVSNTTDLSIYYC